ncbi:hypothetical protein [Mucilaginibacter galii]
MIKVIEGRDEVLELNEPQGLCLNGSGYVAVHAYNRETSPVRSVF